MPSTRQSIPRRIYITKNGISSGKYGSTIGRKGCEAANGDTVRSHNEWCRQRKEKEICQKELEMFDMVVIGLSLREMKKSKHRKSDARDK